MTGQSSDENNMVMELDALVVGAGIAGLYQLYRLREMGLAVRSVEAAPAVGGTWYWNCYPGARVDSQSYAYQYWFSDELIQEWDWSERFPAQEETERYLNFVADKFGLRKDIDFNSRVTSAAWDEDVKRWKIGTDNGRQYQCRFFISCTGMLSGRHPRSLIVVAAAWAVYAAWEWLVLIRTPGANIRIDLMVIWPVLLLISVWFSLRALRHSAKTQTKEKK